MYDIDKGLLVFPRLGPLSRGLTDSVAEAAKQANYTMFDTSRTDLVGLPQQSLMLP